MNIGNRKYRVVTCGAVFCSLLIVGCAPKNALVGKWKPKATGAVNDPIAKLNLIMEFRPDGTTTSSMDIGPRHASVTGTYTVTGDIIKISGTSAAISGMPEGTRRGSGFKAEETDKFKLNGDSLILTKTVGANQAEIEFQRMN